MTVLQEPTISAAITWLDGDLVGAALVSVNGEIDIASAPALREVLDLAMEQGADVVVDLSGVEFFDSAGAVVLQQAANRGHTANGRLMVRNPSPLARKVLEILSMHDLLEPSSRLTAIADHRTDSGTPTYSGTPTDSGTPTYSGTKVRRSAIGAVA